MKTYTAILSAALVLTLATVAGARERTVDAPHLRATNQASGALLADAQQKSATVRELVNKLEQSNVVAYVNVTPLDKGTPTSGLNYVGSSSVQRFVLITIADDASADRRIELLGHELQHAADVAATKWVTSDVQFQRYISMIGWRDSTTARGYETAAANATERQVRRDVREAIIGR
jgi:hypothetical protein